MYKRQVKALAPADMTVTAAWCGIVAFGLQLYFDFAGYSDMAIDVYKRQIRTWPPWSGGCRIC